MIELRYGLDPEGPMTLEDIGTRVGLTRERVRQIEAAGLSAIRGSKAFKEAAGAFDEITKYIESIGVIVPEEIADLYDLPSARCFLRSAPRVVKRAGSD